MAASAFEGDMHADGGAYTTPTNLAQQIEQNVAQPVQTQGLPQPLPVQTQTVQVQPQQFQMQPHPVQMQTQPVQMQPVQMQPVQYQMQPVQVIQAQPQVSPQPSPQASPQPQQIQVHVQAPQTPTKVQNNMAGCWCCCIVANAILFIILAIVCGWALSTRFWEDRWYYDDGSDDYDNSDTDHNDDDGQSFETMYTLFLIFGGGFSALFIVYALVRTSKNTDAGFWALGTFSMLSNITGMVVGLFCCLCTCFSADSMVWVAKTNDIEILNSMVSFGAVPANITDDLVQNIPLRNLEIGDWVLSMDPYTKRVFWDEVMLKIHYNWYDNANQYYSLRRLHLENNLSSITMSDDHFIFVERDDETSVVQSVAVDVGDSVYHYDLNTNMYSVQTVTAIEESVMTQKRVFFTMSPYVLVDNIVASPYVGPHPVYHTILHNGYTFGMRFVSKHPYVWSGFSVFGYFIIYGSYYVVVNCWEFIAIIVTTLYLFSFIFKKVHV